MTFTATTPIMGTAKGSPALIASWAIERGAARPDDVRAYLDALYRYAAAAGLNADVLAAQSHLETDGWRSYWWAMRLNVAGLGITGDPKQNLLSPVFEDGEAAARCHVAHVYLYAVGTDLPTGLAPEDDPRRAAAINAGYVGIAETLDDLNGTWAIDPQNRYGEKIAQRLNEMDAAGLLPADVEEPPMAYVKHQWPGLPNSVYLPDTLPASIKLISSSVAGWTSGTASTRQTTLTQHYTGNSASSAASEWRWAAEGGRASVPGSYNLIVDGSQVIVAQRFDEMVGHAANNTGNYTSYACEMAIAGGYEKAFQNAAHVAAAVIVSKGWEVDTGLIQHWNWLRANGERKNCPSIIRDKGDWSRFMATVTRNVAAIRAFLGGAASGGDGTGGAPVVYPAPVPIPVLAEISSKDGLAPFYVVDKDIEYTWIGDRVRAKVPTPRWRFADMSEKVGPDLKQGEEFDLDWKFAYDGKRFGMTPGNTRVELDSLERISDSKGEAA